MPTMKRFLFGPNEHRRMNLQLFAGEEEPTPGAGGATPTPEDKGGENKISFSPEQQAEVDRIIAERLNRASNTAGKKALEEQAKSLGYESFEAMQTAAKAYQAAKDKEKSDLQREQEAKAAAEAKATQAEERAKQAYIKASFVAHAATANLVDVEDAFRLADLSSVTVKDDGTVEGVKEVVEALVKAKPYLVKAGTGATLPGGGNPPRGGGGETGAQDKARASQMAAQRLGVAQNNTDATAIATAVAAAVAQVIGQNK